MFSEIEWKGKGGRPGWKTGWKDVTKSRSITLGRPCTVAYLRVALPMHRHGKCARGGWSLRHVVEGVDLVTHIISLTKLEEPGTSGC